MARTARRMLWPLLVVAGLIGALSLSWFPARTWLGQQEAISARQAELDGLDAQVAALERRIEALDSPEEIERLARDQYNMVRPGEEAYSILPMPVRPLEIPPGWPFTPAPSATD
jgi:cell division protein FtsB